MKIKAINWKNFLFMGGYHLALFVCLPVYLMYRMPSMGLLIATLILIIVTGISITAGYHRLYAHRTYQMHPIMQVVILCLGAIGVQNNVLSWSYNHRHHHSFTDKEQDPHNITKGFWYAHILWIIEKTDRKFDPDLPQDLTVVQDLVKNRLVMLQYRYYTPLMLGLNALIVVAFGALFHDYFGAFTFLFLLRLFVTHHATFFINSLAHTWGSQPYSDEHSAVNNWIMAFLTFGEGYHNYHHTFSSDYRNGVRWYQYDPTKMFIWALSKVGLAEGLHRMNDYVIKRRLLLEDRRLLLGHLKEASIAHKERLEERVVTMYEQLSTKLAEFQKAVQEYQALKKEKARRDAIIEAEQHMYTLDKTIHTSFREWGRLCREVLKGHRKSYSA